MKMERMILMVPLLLLVFGALQISGCSKATSLRPPKELNTKLLSVSEKLEEAQEENAEDTWEYEEAEKLFERAKSLITEGNFQEAEKVLSETEVKVTQAIGAAREDVFMERIDEDAQEIRKSLLRNSFSKENLINLPTSDVFFEYDSAQISQEITKIDQNVSVFEKNKDKIKFILVFGFCDLRGTEEYNLSLGKKRADEIKKYMIGKGLSPEILHSISRGETEIWKEGISEEAYSQNRRGHFIAISSNTPSDNQ